MFNAVDTEQKAYLLGWIASDGSVGKKGAVFISIHKKDFNTLSAIRNIVCPEIPIFTVRDKELIGFCICSSQICLDVCRHLKIQPGKKYDCVQFPDLQTDALRWAFLRGYFDGDGCLVRVSLTEAPRASISSYSQGMLKSIADFVGLRHGLSGNNVTWSGLAALHMLSNMYDHASTRLQRKNELYLDWAGWKPMIPGSNDNKKRHPDSFLEVLYCDLRAQIPRPVKVGFLYSIALIEKLSERHGNLSAIYDTGIKLRPKIGYFGEVHGTPELTSKGYIVTNIELIDIRNPGTVIVMITRVSSSVPELTLPCEDLQVRFSQIVDAIVVEEELTLQEIVQQFRNGTDCEAQICSVKRTRLEAGIV